MAVAGREERLAGLAARPRRVEHRAVDAADPVDERVEASTGSHHRQVRGAQEGHRGDPRRHLAAAVGERDHELLGVDRRAAAAPQPRHRADDPHPDVPEHRVGRAEAGRRVVVAGDHEHVEPGHARPRARRRSRVELRLRARGRVRGVEDVAGDDERVHLLALEHVEQEREEARVLVLARVPVQRVPEVPVRGVADLQ